MSLIYLASPYSHPDRAVMDERFEAACRAAASLMSQGLHVFSPIAHSHSVAVVGGLDLVDLDFWLGQDMAVLRFCDELRVLRLDGWDLSKGISREMAWAREHGMPLSAMEPVQ